MLRGAYGFASGSGTGNRGLPWPVPRALRRSKCEVAASALNSSPPLTEDPRTADGGRSCAEADAVEKKVGHAAHSDAVLKRVSPRRCYFLARPLVHQLLHSPFILSSVDFGSIFFAGFQFLPCPHRSSAA